MSHMSLPDRPAVANPEADWQQPDQPDILRPDYGPGYRLPLTLGLVVFSGLLLGLASAFLLLDRGTPFGAITIGAWQAYPEAGTPEADPYSAAISARTASMPLGSGEGLAFTAFRDSNGVLLDPACDYVLEGQTPPARLWTLHAADGAGKLQPTLPGRLSLISSQLLRRPDGSFVISAAAGPKSGNWLPTGSGTGLRFVLRLYDAPITTGATSGGLTMPTITRGACR